MVALITDRSLERRLIRHRRRMGADRFDEVWEGVYFMAPSPDNQHQSLSTDLVTPFKCSIDAPGLGLTVMGVNISDRFRRWRKNFRVPDLAVLLKGTRAIEHRAHWEGGPDFGLEIVSPNDRTDEKIPFYEKVGTTELLIIDRDPWSIRLYRRIDGRRELMGTSTTIDHSTLPSEVIPLSFQLVVVDGSPAIQLSHHDGMQRWVIRPRALPTSPRPLP